MVVMQVYTPDTTDLESTQLNGYYTYTQASDEVPNFSILVLKAMLKFKFETTADGIAVAGIVTATSGIVLTMVTVLH